MFKIVSKTALAVFILGIVQVTFLELFKAGGFKPNLCIIGVIYFGLIKGRYFGFYTGAASGLIYGIFSSLPFPLHLISFALAGYLAGLLSPHIYRDNPVWQLIAGFASSAFILLCDYAISGAFFGFGNLIGFTSSILLPLSIYTAVVSPAVFFILMRFI